MTKLNAVNLHFWANTTSANFEWSNYNSKFESNQQIQPYFVSISDEKLCRINNV